MSNRLLGQQDNSTKFIAWIESYSRKDFARKNANQNPSRGWSDSVAAWQKWHSKKIEPVIQNARKPWYIALERSRVEALASYEMEGIRSNLSVRQCPKFRTLTPDGLYILTRQIFSHEGLGPAENSETLDKALYPFSALTRLCRFFGLKQIQPRRAWIQRQLYEARRHLADQELFQDAILNLISTLPDLSSSKASEELGVSPPVNRPDTHWLAVNEDSGSPETDATSDKETAGSGQLIPGRSSDYYWVFNREFDEVGPASHWLVRGDSELLALLKSPERKRIQKMARKLQRKLLAHSGRRWEFDCVEGMLDSRTLPRLITAQDDQRIFRQELVSEEDQAFVSFLVDLSGSMNHQRRVMAALTLDMVLHTLDQCSIGSEALGYTTRFFHPNPLVHEWREQGSSPNPGRLNAARHIVLKNAKQRWKVSRESLALLLKKDFGRENLDGEALHWAARRLAARAERRKILIVLSDGEPYDEATELANGASYLDNHMRTVIKGIEESGIRLSAIGFGSQVGRFYTHSLSVSRVDELPNVIFDRIDELLLTNANLTH